jgi:hypothetical protein
MTRLLPFVIACLSGLGLAFFGASPSPPSTSGYAENPPLAHTGGFGEPTCQACHFDQPLNAPNGSLTLTGLPNSYVTGTAYEITVALRHPDLGRGGFELSARFSDGTQAGTLRAVTERSTVSTEDAGGGVQYAYHTATGAMPTAPELASWTLEWVAPARGDSVVFHVSANAANFDASEFGDFVYTAQQHSNASGGSE